DCTRLALFRMNVHIGSRYVHVAAQEQRQARGLVMCGEPFHGFEESHLPVEVLAAVGYVNRRDSKRRQSGGDDAVLVVEFGVVKGRTLQERLLADVQADSGVSPAAVPVAPVALDLAEPDGQLI